MNNAMRAGAAVALAGAVVLGTVALLWAGRPGEKAVGPAFPADNFTLVWGKMSTTGDVDLGHEERSRYTIRLEGSLEAPADMDAVAVYRRFRPKAITDARGVTVVAKNNSSSHGEYRAYNAFHGGIGQVELDHTELTGDAAGIDTLVLGTDVILAQKRAEAKMPAVVMEDYKEIGQGILIRVTSLNMSAARELTVVAAYKRRGAGVGNPFIEAIYVLDPAGNQIGGGRWTEGDPFGDHGTITVKVGLTGDQVHQAFRVIMVTECTIKPLTFTIRKADLHRGPSPAGDPPAPNPAAPKPAEPGKVELPPLGMAPGPVRFARDAV